MRGTMIKTTAKSEVAFSISQAELATCQLLRDLGLFDWMKINRKRL